MNFLGFLLHVSRPTKMLYMSLFLDLRVKVATPVAIGYGDRLPGIEGEEIRNAGAIRADSGHHDISIHLTESKEVTKLLDVEITCSLTLFSPGRSSRTLGFYSRPPAEGPASHRTRGRHRIGHRTYLFFCSAGHSAASLRRFLFWCL